MVTQAVIEEVKNRLVKAYDPLAIYLFGSYAWGTPDEDSDLDILIVVEKSDEKSYKRPLPGQRILFGLGISKDLVVYTKEEFERALTNPTTLAYKVGRDGRLMYAKS
jgi:predicted nucleotidyltransferase